MLASTLTPARHQPRTFTERQSLTDSLVVRKARGAFFTPPEMSRFIADWALRSPSDKVLEPSAGEAIFLLAAAERLGALSALRSPNDPPPELHGVELHPASARAAEQVLARTGLQGSVRLADFFEVEPEPVYDAVIGNPPYIRYQSFTGAVRAKAMKAALAQGVRLTGLASAWAPFTVHATRFLKPSGRLGLVLPAELLSVNYAASVRRFLLERFGRVRLVMFEELVFPGVLEEVVLLLAEGQGPAPTFEVYQARSLEDLEQIEKAAVWTWFTPERDGKWTPALLSSGALDAYRALEEVGGFEQLLEWGDTYLGSVTGNNRFFTLTADEARALNLTKKELRAISPPGSRHLRGLTFSEQAWEQQAADGAAAYLFYPDDYPSAAARDYIKAGEKDNVHKAYKCRVRSPWWRVPVVKVPDLLLTYMDHERPRLVTNDAKVLHLNSLYGVLLRADRRELGRELLPLAVLNSATLLGAEMVGRAYGGGLLKLEPKEADKLLVPSLDTIEASADELRKVRAQVGRLLRQGKLMEAVAIVDRILLSSSLSVSYASLKAIRDAREVLFQRRSTRGKGQCANGR